MKKITILFTVICMVSLSVISQDQSKTITGKVFSEKNVPVVKASVKIKNSSGGVITDEQGKFSLSAPVFPVTLEITSTGFESEEVTVSTTGEVSVMLQTLAKTLNPVVIAGTRTEGKLTRSPVSIEILGKNDINNSPSDPYSSLLSKKSLDVVISSITYKTYSTRGFNGSGSSRVNQLMDGMDNQAPGLNFYVGNFIGLTDLDIDNIQILPGASSALYGPGGLNGTILVNSKNPFKYPGLSVLIKNGITDIGKHQRNKAGGYYDYSIRWAKNFNDRFAFKIGAQYLQANDWLANDTSNYLRMGAGGKVIAGTRQTDPNYDGVNVYGDETFIGGQSIKDIFRNAAHIMMSQNPQIAPKLFQLMASDTTNLSPVSRTGYQEHEVIDPKTKNIKLSGSFHYKFRNNLEALIAGHWATGNTVYTGNNRYSLKDIKMGQYKVELKNKNWFLRGYTTQENAGEAYSATVTTQIFNESWKQSFSRNVTPQTFNNYWYGQYAFAYWSSRLMNDPVSNSHNAARSFADRDRPLPGSARFKQLFDSVRSVAIPNGGLFVETSQLWMGEGQYSFSDKIKFADIIVGGNYKKYILNSEGTLFYEPDGPIRINEWGAYAQVTKKLFDERLTLSASGRYDKNENFKGKFTPRFTALIKLAEGHNLRMSYQTAYKFPTTQQQWIRLDVGSVILLGGLPWILDVVQPEKYPTYVYDNGQLSPWEYKRLKPESMRSFEVGYKSIINKKLLIDMYAYFGKYTDFLGRIVLVQPTTTNKPYSIVVNSDTKVNTWGAGIGFDYKMANNFFSFLNAYTDNLTNVPGGFQAGFNTPKYRVNAGFGNSGLGKKEKIGFNVNFRWQDSFHWEGNGLADGNVKAYTTVDAQVNYKLPKIKSMIKIGGTNITNKFYKTGFGNPSIGGMYYASFAFNIL